MPSIDLSGVEHHHAINEVVGVLCNRTENTDRGFFNCEVAYYFGKMASNMRCVIVTKDRKDVPVNIYTVALANSGYGKGHSVYVMEEEILGGFRKRFMDETLPIKTQESFWKLADERALRTGPSTDQQQEYDKIVSEDKRTGAFVFTFDSGTTEGVKQIRHKLLLAQCGSINLQVDEIGSNLEKVIEVLNTFLELYDQGKVKTKLIKSSRDSVRDEEVEGKTPTNMLLFGTPAKLFNGAATENMFYELLETGFARRCLFGYGSAEKKARNSKTSAEVYHDKINPANDVIVKKWSNNFTELADPARFGWQTTLEDDVAIRLIDYQFWCDERIALMKDFEVIHKIEMEHRYFKALKLAGAYAFIDSSNEVEMEHLMSAILLIEESGEAFTRILQREKPQVRLARYLADVGIEVTHHDLMTDLPSYPKNIRAGLEMINLATAWGYKNNVVIKKTFADGFDLFKGETLKVTDLNEIRLSWSTAWADGYEPELARFEDLGEGLAIAQQMGDDDEPNGMHLQWANHHFHRGHRSDESVIPGFNMIVLDVDGGISVDTATGLLSEIKHMIYTTKRSTPEVNRFRLLIPTNYILELDKDDYKEMMLDIMKWLPFEAKAEIDHSSAQRSKTWQTNPQATVVYNMEAPLFDVLPFIPKTRKNEDYRKDFEAVESMDNLERWFAGQMAQGSRNNNMIKFALALVDGGMNLIAVSQAVHAFNKKLVTPLPEAEIDMTIMTTAAKRIMKKAA